MRIYVGYDKLITHVLYDEPVFLLASPQHPLSANPCVSLEDMHRELLILTEAGCNYRTRFENSVVGL
jgi:DNA-binding transcriptional LysR family regulator